MGQTQYAAESYLGWWKLAGVDYSYLENSTALLGTELPSETVPIDAIAPAITASLPHAPATNVAMRALPGNWDDIKNWLARSPDLPGAHWSPLRAAPEGDGSNKCVIFTDFPEVSAERGILSKTSHVLLSAMLNAIGIELDQALLIPLAYARPPGARIDAASASGLALIAKHILATVDHQQLLILGDQTTRALLGTDFQESRGRLRDVNHSHGTTPAVVTFHPRFLVERPAYKRAAWEDLKLMMKDRVARA